MVDTSILFEPVKVAGTTFANRIAMAPMTRGFSPDGVPGQNVADYYARRAANNVGLLISEGTLINRGGAADNPNYPLFYGEKPLAGWKKVVDDVHGNGGKIAPQIWHIGMVRKTGTGHHPDAPTDSPSGITHNGKQLFEAPTTKEVEDMAAAYIQAGADAKRLGFDAVEIHGAHGYLVDQFFWDVMNKRDDAFGGDLPARASFAGDIIKGIRKEVGDDFPIILRWSQWKQQDYTARLAPTPQELEKLLAVFADAGVDVIHCSQRRYWEPEFPEIDGENGLNLAGWAKKITGKATMSVGSVGLSSDFFGAFAGQDSKYRPMDDLIERMEKGEFDFIAVGRALLQDPEWATKVKEGRLDDLLDYDGEANKTLF